MDQSRQIVRFAVLCVLATLLQTVAAWAQSPLGENLPAPANTPEELPAVAAEAAAPAPPRMTFMDRRMAICLAIDAQIGLDLANWAAVHGRDPRVKQFAQSMAADSMALLKVLDERSEGRITAALRDGESDDTAAEKKTQRTAGKLSVLNAEKVLMRMKYEIADGSSESLRTQLESTPAESIDVTYVGGEVFRQVQMLSTLKVLRKYCSQGFEPVLNDTIRSTEQNLATTLTMLREVHGRAMAAKGEPAAAVVEHK